MKKLMNVKRFIENIAYSRRHKIFDLYRRDGHVADIGSICKWIVEMYKEYDSGLPQKLCQCAKEMIDEFREIDESPDMTKDIIEAMKKQRKEGE